MSETHSLGRLVRWRIPGVRTDQTFRELLAAYPFCVLDEGEHWSISGLCGRIWTLQRDYPRLDGPEDFRAWSEPGTVRVLIANWVERDGDGSTHRLGGARGPRRPPRRAAPALAVGRDRRLRAADRRRGARPRRRARRLAGARAERSRSARRAAGRRRVRRRRRGGRRAAGPRGRRPQSCSTRSSRRRLTGEPLAWITGSVCVLRPGDRASIPASTSRAGRARRWRCAPSSACRRTGRRSTSAPGPARSPKTLMARRPGARVVATDVDERAVACARRNGVDAHRGDLFAPLAPRAGGTRRRRRRRRALRARRPTCRCCSATPSTFESHAVLRRRRRTATELLRRVVADSPRFLRHGGALLLELGGEQADALRDDLARLRLRRRRGARATRTATSAASRRRSR